MNCPSCKAVNDDEADTCIACGRGLFALLRGDVLSGRYEILGALGKGGMGVVYKAHDRELEEVVAIKVLRAAFAMSSDMSKRFRSEIKLARRVRHENVCGIHEYGQDGHLRFIVMEYVQGVDLRQLLRRRGALPPAEAYAVAINVARGLQAIHNVGIVHRDLKTPNVMQDEKGRIRLMDFGIAKQFEVEPGSSATQTGHIVGTPEYMSPEQAQGKKVDPRSDVYALAVLTFELFTGDVPFRGDTPVATLLMHLQSEPPLDAHPLPPLLVPILKKALAKDRDDRYASAAEMAEALIAAQPASARAHPAIPTVILTAALAEPALQPGTQPMPTPVPTSIPSVTPIPAETAKAARIARTMPPPAAPAAVPARPSRAGATSFGWKWIVAVPLMAVAGLVVVRTLPPMRENAGATTAGQIASSTGNGVPQGVPPTTLSARTPAPAPPAPAAAAPKVERSAVPAPTPTPAAPERHGALPTPGPARTPSSTPQVQVVAPATRPAAAPSPSAAPPAPVSEEPGLLQLMVEPWADVTVDGKAMGMTPLRKLPLAPGPHNVRLVHPDYEPWQRRVGIRAAETTVLKMNFAWDGVKR